MEVDKVNINDLDKRMIGALKSLQTDFHSLRTGRASASMLDSVIVEVYGAKVPISQCSTINVPEPRMLTVSVWDKTNLQAVEKALRNSGLGINPVSEGTLLRLPIPELAKIAAQYAENARIAIRNVRRDGMDMVKKAKLDGMSEDDEKLWSSKIQKLTDTSITEIDILLKSRQDALGKV